MLKKITCMVFVWITFVSGNLLAQENYGRNRVANPGRWISLFNGQDLTGWTVMGDAKDAFYVEDGVLACNGKGGDWIRSASQFEDFHLRMEYKISAGGNSGIFIHSASEGTPWKTGFEVQLVDSFNKGINQPDRHTSGAIYDVLTPMLNCVKSATEWNTIEVACRGTEVAVILNGFKIIDSDFSKLTEKIGKYDIPYSQLPRKGYIGFQDHHTPVWFRNIEIRPLAERAERGERMGAERAAERGARRSRNQ